MDEQLVIDKTDELNNWTKTALNFRSRLLEYLHSEQNTISQDTAQDPRQIWWNMENFYNNYEKYKQKLLITVCDDPDDFLNLSLNEIYRIVKEKHSKPCKQIFIEYFEILEQPSKFFLDLSKRREIISVISYFHRVLKNCALILSDYMHLYPDLGDFYHEMFQNCIQIIKRIENQTDQLIKIFT